MTTSVNNQQTQISPALKSMMTSPSTPTKSVPLESKADVFVKKASDPTNIDKITKVLGSILGFSIAAILGSKAIKLFDKLEKFLIKDNAPKKISNIWENLSSCVKISEMSLSDNLRELFNKVIRNIEDPIEIEERGGKGIKTILLYGPPGTGKTTFAKAIACEFPNSRFASLDVTNLGSKYVGETEKNIQSAVNEICAQAQDNPDVKFFVFVDEIDSIMMVDDGSSKKYSNDVLNEFKRCFTERLGKQKNIITIGATNIPIDTQTGKTFDGKMLDKPMLDRFQEKILVDLPTKEQINDFFVANYKQKSKVCDELKDKNNEKLKIICEFLENKKHNVSFRTLQSIFEDAASTCDKNKNVGIREIYNVIKSKRVELKIDDDELNMLANDLKIIP